MEWKVIDCPIIEGYGTNVQKVIGYFDGYLGVEGYELEYIVLEDYEVEQMIRIKNTLKDKIGKYSKIENPNDIILKQLNKIEFLYNKYTDILKTINKGE